MLLSNEYFGKNHWHRATTGKPDCPNRAVAFCERIKVYTAALVMTAIVIPGLLLFSETSKAQLNRGGPEILNEIGVDEKLGDQVPLDVTFTNSEGETVTLAELTASGKPILLNPLYYECPMLCNVVGESVLKVARELRWTPGEDYTIISFSIDPEEDYTMSANRKEDYLSQLGRDAAADGWHFLTGEEEQIRRLTDAVGFKYVQEERTGEYLHSSSIIFLSPDGIVTRYLHGLEFPEFALRNALYESADGRIGSTVDQAILYCFTYDPASESYIPVAMNIMKLGGLATLIILGIFLGLFWTRERRRRSNQSQTFDYQE